VARIPLAARAVLFDWDGTLLDSYHSDARAYLAMFRALDIDWGLDDLARHYSPNWYRLYRAAKIPPSLWKKADRLWEKAYEEESPRLLPGARRVLRQLERRFLLGLVTSGNSQRVRRQLREFRLRQIFSACVCSEDAPRRKPHPAPLELAIRKLQIKPKACVYVGDTPDDVEMARSAGVRVIAVLGPFPTHDRLRAIRPDILLDSITELPDWVAWEADQS
jgi:HAD superfamily hydrolase (TIGR01509 family)